MASLTAIPVVSQTTIVVVVMIGCLCPCCGLLLPFQCFVELQAGPQADVKGLLSESSYPLSPLLH